MIAPRRVELLGALIALACGGLVIVRTGAIAPAPAPDASPATMKLLASTVAVKEDGWRKKAVDGFPADLWSQRDAFHGHEASAVRDLASTHHVRYGDVLRAVDVDMRGDRGDGSRRGAAVAPCKPRPFYD